MAEIPERAVLLREAEPLVVYAHLQRMETSFPGWFPTDPWCKRRVPTHFRGSLELTLRLAKLF